MRETNLINGNYLDRAGLSVVEATNEIPPDATEPVDRHPHFIPLHLGGLDTPGASIPFRLALRRQSAYPLRPCSIPQSPLRQRPRGTKQLNPVSSCAPCQLWRSLQPASRSACSPVPTPCLFLITRSMLTWTVIVVQLGSCEGSLSGPGALIPYSSQHAEYAPRVMVRQQRARRCAWRFSCERNPIRPETR